MPECYVGYVSNLPYCSLSHYKQPLSEDRPLLRRLIKTSGPDAPMPWSEFLLTLVGFGLRSSLAPPPQEQFWITCVPEKSPGGPT